MKKISLLSSAFVLFMAMTATAATTTKYVCSSIKSVNRSDVEFLIKVQSTKKDGCVEQTYEKKFFCVEPVRSNGALTVLLSQFDSDKSDGNVSCFEDWFESAEINYDMGLSATSIGSVTGGAYGSIMELATNTIIDTLKLTSDIDFGGAKGDACVREFLPLQARYFKNFDGENKTVSNLCFSGAKTIVDDVEGSFDFYFNGGFFGEGAAMDVGETRLNVKDVAFENTFVFGGEYVGVVSGYALGSAENVTVKSSRLSGTTVGGVFGAGVINTYNGVKVESTVIEASLSGGALVGAGFAVNEGSIVKNSFARNDTIRVVSTTPSAGGLIGVVEKYGNSGAKFDIRESGVENSLVEFGCVASQLSRCGSATAGGVVGFVKLMDDCPAYSFAMTLDKVWATGDVGQWSVSSKIVNAYAGGIIGYFEGAENNVDDHSLTISNTYTIGDVTAGHAGYLVGWISGADFKIGIFNNYHFGENDEATALGVSNADEEAWYKGYLGSRSNYEAYRNFRNILDDSKTQPYVGVGDGLAHLYPPCHDPGDVFYDGKNAFEMVDGDIEAFPNGDLPSAQMKTDYFAAVLNDECDDLLKMSVWSRADSENGKLPFFANDEYLPNTYVQLVWDESLFSDDEKTTMKNASSKTVDGVNAGGAVEPNSSYLATDYTQKLPKDAVESVLSLEKDAAGKTKDYAWISISEPLQANRAYAAPVAYEWAWHGVFNIVYHLCEVDDSVPMNEDGVCQGNDYIIPSNASGQELEDFKVHYVFPRLNGSVDSKDNLMITPILVNKPSMSGGVQRDNFTVVVASDVFLRSKTEGEKTSVVDIWGDAHPFWRLPEIVDQIVRTISNFDYSALQDTLHVVYQYDRWERPIALMDSLHGRYDYGEKYGFDYNTFFTLTDPFGYTISFDVALYAYGNTGELDSAGVVSNEHFDYNNTPSIYMGPANAIAFKNIEPLIGMEVKGYKVTFSPKWGGEYPHYQGRDKHILSLSEFYAKPEGYWETDTIPTDSILYLDSLVVGLMDGLFTLNDYMLDVDFVMETAKYNMDFDLAIPLSVDSANIFLGWNWKKNKDVSYADPELPKVYDIRPGETMAVKRRWSRRNESDADTMVVPAFLERVGDAKDFVLNWDNHNSTNGKIEIDVETYVEGMRAPNSKNFFSDVSEWSMLLEMVQDIDGENSISHRPDVQEGSNSTVFTSSFMLPVFQDTLHFKLKTYDIFGYEVTDVFFDIPAGATAGSAGDVLVNKVLFDAGDTTINIDPWQLALASPSEPPTLKVDYRLKTFDVALTRPLADKLAGLKKSDGTPVDVFVHGDYRNARWMDYYSYVIDMNGSAFLPKLYAADGCVLWSTKEELSSVDDFLDDNITNDLIKQMDENNLVLYPVYHEIVDADDATCGDYNDAEPAKVTLETNGHGTIEFWQIIGMNEPKKKMHQDTIKHKFTPVAGKENVFELNTFVPPSGRGYSQGGLMPANPLELATMVFEVHVVPDSGYVCESDCLYEVSGRNRIVYDVVDSLQIDGDKTMFASFAPAVPDYREFVFNANADDNVFYGADWASKGKYQLNLNGNAQEFPKDVYRIGECLDGWTFEPNGTIAFTTYDNMFEKAIAAFDELGLPTDTLYGIWSACNNSYYMVTFGSADEGSLFLYQNVDGDMLSFEQGKDGLKVPAVKGEAITLNALFTADYGKVAKEGKSLKIKNNDGSVRDSIENDGAFAVTANTRIDVDVAVKDFLITFDLGRDSSKLFFNEDWTQRKDRYELGWAGGAPLPAVLYSAEECLEGWTIEKGAETVYGVFDEDLAGRLMIAQKSDSMKFTLYAKWTREEDRCLATFMRVAAKSSNGTFALVETVGDSRMVHEFNKDGTMLLPAAVNGQNLYVVASPDSSFTLDSLVAVREGSNERYVVLDSAAMPFDMVGLNLQTFFGKANKTPVEFVKSDLTLSGNAVRLTYTLSNFEVTRGVSVAMELVDRETNALVTRKVLTDSAAMGLQDTFELYPIQQGSYKLLAMAYDAIDGDTLKNNFEVSLEVANVVADGWSMISLAAVDTVGLSYDGDQILYWWDENTLSGEYWQYNTFKPGDELVRERGYWYSSFEGRPLNMLSSIEDDGADVEWKLDSVYSGWNLVANPHGWALDIFGARPEDKRGANEKPKYVFWRYDAAAAEYVETTEIKPFEAVWVYVERPEKWVVPAKPLFATDSSKSALQKPALAKAESRGNWTLRAMLKDASGKSDSWNVFGAANKPFAVDEPPESMGDHVSLAFVDGKKVLAKSVKTPADEMEWTVELKANTNRLGYLSMEGVGKLNALGLKVFVTVDGNTTEMSDGKELRVALSGKSKYATVRVAEKARVTVAGQLDGFKAVKVRSGLQVSFNADQGLAGARARVDLVDMKGHVVASAAATTLAGTNSVTLTAPKPGLYMVSVRAGSQMGAGKVVVK